MFPLPCKKLCYFDESENTLLIKELVALSNKYGRLIFGWINWMSNKLVNKQINNTLVKIKFF